MSRDFPPFLNFIVTNFARPSPLFVLLFQQAISTAAVPPGNLFAAACGTVCPAELALLTVHLRGRRDRNGAHPRPPIVRLEESPGLRSSLLRNLPATESSQARECHC